MDESKKNILILCGGGSEEHDISLISAQSIYDALKENSKFNILKVIIQRDGTRVDQDQRKCELRKDGLIYFPDSSTTHKLHFAIPCFHGYPGETGDIQSLFEMMGLPYLGSNSEASKNCFNKVTTKLWLSALGIPNTPFKFMSEYSEEQCKEGYDELGPDIYVKASSQGSSFGCYHVQSIDKMSESVRSALKLSPYALIEKTIKARELEIAVYQKGDQLIATDPGEIKCPTGFYTFEEKYSKDSKTNTQVKAEGIDPEVIEKLKEFSIKAFKGMNLRHLSRFDFFLTDKNQILLNEVNTFPGMTPTSLFPLMLKESGVELRNFIESIIEKNIRN